MPLEHYYADYHDARIVRFPERTAGYELDEVGGGSRIGNGLQVVGGGLSLSRGCACASSTTLSSAPCVHCIAVDALKLP